jgi:hypothetical protein
MIFLEKAINQLIQSGDYKVNCVCKRIGGNFYGDYGNVIGGYMTERLDPRMWEET